MHTKIPVMQKNNLDPVNIFSDSMENREEIKGTSRSRTKSKPHRFLNVCTSFSENFLFSVDFLYTLTTHSQHIQLVHYVRICAYARGP